MLLVKNNQKTTCSLKKDTYFLHNAKKIKNDAFSGFK